MNSDADVRVPMTPVWEGKGGPGKDGGGRMPCMHRFRVLLLALMCAQILIGSGVVYGWPALETTLIDLGVYADACQPGPAGVMDTSSSLVAGSTQAAAVTSVESRRACHAQLLKLNDIYVAASWGCQATGVLGFVLDKIGVKYTVVGSSLALALGAALFALSSGSGSGADADHGARPLFDMYLPGLTLMGVAGGGIYLAAQGLGNLFPTSTRRVALFLITGVFAPSMLVFLLFRFLVVEVGVISLRMAFLIYAGVQVVLACVSFIVWPHEFQALEDAEEALMTPASRAITPVSHAGGARAAAGEDGGAAAPLLLRKPHSKSADIVRPSGGDSVGSGGGGSNSSNSEGMAAAAPPVYGSLASNTTSDLTLRSGGIVLRKQASIVSTSGPPPSFSSQLLDIRFWMQVLMFSVMLLPAQFYIGNLSSQVARYTTSHNEVTTYSQNFNFVYSFVSFATPVLGWVTDKVGFGNTYLLVTALYMASFAAMSWAPALPFLYVSFVVYTFARNGQFSLFVSYLAATFGPTHLGKLIGIGFLASAMVSLGQEPLLHVVLSSLDGNFKYANIAFMASLVAMAPYGLWLLCGAKCCGRCRHRDQQQQEAVAV